MAIRLSTALKTYALASGLATAFDGGTGRIAVYTGAQPATADIAASGTRLGTLALASDAFGDPASGALALNPVTGDASADADGTAGYLRFYRSTDTAPDSTSNGTTDRRMDIVVGSDISIDDPAIVAGGALNLSGWTYTHG